MMAEKKLCDCPTDASWLLMGIAKLAESVGARDVSEVERDTVSAGKLLKDLEACLGRAMPRTKEALMSTESAAKKGDWDKSASETFYATVETIREGC